MNVSVTNKPSLPPNDTIDLQLFSTEIGCFCLICLTTFRLLQQDQGLKRVAPSYGGLKNAAPKGLHW